MFTFYKNAIAASFDYKAKHKVINAIGNCHTLTSHEYTELVARFLKAVRSV